MRQDSSKTKKTKQQNKIPTLFSREDGPDQAEELSHKIQGLNMQLGNVQCLAQNIQDDQLYLRIKNLKSLQQSTLDIS